MRPAFIVRLVDITLLLLLSLMAVASLDPYGVQPPLSEEVPDRGAMVQPLQVALTADGTLIAHGPDGAPLMLSPAELATRVSGEGQGVEVIADGHVHAQILLALHKALDAEGIRAAFLVQHIHQQR